MGSVGGFKSWAVWWWAAARRPDWYLLPEGFDLTRRLLAILALAAIGCGDGSTNPGEPAVAYAAGTVRDENGSLLPNAFVEWESWPKPDADSMYHSPGSYTDSMGQFVHRLGAYTVRRLDSVRLRLKTDQCLGYDTLAYTWHGLDLHRVGADTVLRTTVVAPVTYPAARLEVGTSCAKSAAPTGTGSVSHMMYLMLGIQEIGDSVRGVWHMNYWVSRGDDRGSFSGVRRGDSLLLDLSLDEPWDACFGYSLRFGIGPGDTLQPGSYESDGCFPSPVQFRMVESDELDWLLFN